MSEVTVLPELKQIVGALLFAAKKPLTASDVVSILRATAVEYGGAMEDFAELKKKDVEATLQDLLRELAGSKLGFNMVEVAGGYRLENDVECGSWLRMYLQKGKTSRLSRPSLETLAIIAYRQPCTRSEVESVRGVAVDQIVRNLLEMQLVKVTGRSELPGRPWLFGTTQKFLEHFGLSNLDDLPDVSELRRLEKEQASQKKQDPDAEQPEAKQVELEEVVSEPEVPAELAEGAEAGSGTDRQPEKRIDLALGEVEDEDEDEFDDEDEEEDDYLD